ncbi:ATP-binding protein [Lewinella sp. IMCC34191]|uniref:PAS domain-containing hybrid sensor histidine kinase/response regulator n=1 Tax=Lewinella sp. IMCC34191 TaxID=2259172 RepID=UPI000E254B1D|nr:ATP-binding protein [Lewinella sp. IMCC34191]
MTDSSSSLNDRIQKGITKHAADFFDQAPCGCIITTTQGEVIRFNDQLRGWLGYGKDDLPEGLHFADLINKGGRIFYETHFAPQLAMNGQISGIALKFLRKDQTELSVLIAARRHYDGEGEPLFQSIVVTNFTDRKVYEEGLLAAKRTAEDNDQAKSVFLSTISHEILTPLNAVLGTAELLGASDLSDQQSHLQSILVRSGNHLLSLFKNILIISKSGLDELEPVRQPFRPESLLSTTVDSFRYGSERRNFVYALEIDENTPEVLIGDSTLLTQVITNLVGNASKFTKTGTVTAGVSVLERKDDDTCRLRFFVRDTGIGVEQKHLDRLFTPFTQAYQNIHEQYGGSGLGLSICNNILKEYGSKVEVESRIGEGSTFWFDLTLPVGDPAEATSEHLGNLPPINQGHVLIVEDNRTNSFLVARYFRKWEVAFDIAHNGQEALEAVASKPYDLILMDLKMPVMDGYSAARGIREMPAPVGNVPIIAFSASASLAISERMRVAQIDDFILKPFAPRHLYNLVSQYLNPSIMKYPELREAMDNNPEDLERFAEVLQRELTLAADELVTALSKNDAQKVADIKHKLKTSLQLMDGTAIQHDFAAVSQDLRNGVTVSAARKSGLVEKIRQASRELSRERW